VRVNSRQRAHVRVGKSHYKRVLCSKGMSAFQGLVQRRRRQSLSSLRAKYFIDGNYLSRFYAAINDKLINKAMEQRRLRKGMMFWMFRRYLQVLNRLKQMCSYRREKRRLIHEAFQYYEDNLDKTACRMFVRYSGSTKATEAGTSSNINVARTSWLVRKFALKWLSQTRRIRQASVRQQENPPPSADGRNPRSQPHAAVQQGTSFCAALTSPLGIQLSISTKNPLTLAPPAIPSFVLPAIVQVTSSSDPASRSAIIPREIDLRMDVDAESKYEDLSRSQSKFCTNALVMAKPRPLSFNCIALPNSLGSRTIQSDAAPRSLDNLAVPTPISNVFSTNYMHSWHSWQPQEAKVGEPEPLQFQNQDFQTQLQEIQAKLRQTLEMNPLSGQQASHQQSNLLDICDADGLDCAVERISMASPEQKREWKQQIAIEYVRLLQEQGDQHTY
jgi:hypothetical protein